MKNLLRIISFITLLIFSSVYANGDDTNRKAAYLKSLTNFLPTFGKNADQIWPGLSINNTPLVILFNFNSDDSLYAFNFVPQNKQWKKEIINNMTTYHMEHDVLGAHQFHSTLTQRYFNLENKNALLYSPFSLSGELFEFNHFILAGMYYAAHEVSTSAMAKERIENYTTAKMIHDGFNKPEELSLLFLESAALFEFSKTKNEEALKDFAATAQYRTAIMHSTTKIFEGAYPTLPCFAYVGLKATIANEYDLYTKLQNESPILIASNFEERLFSGLKDDYLTILHYNQKLASFALDKVESDWKKTATSTNLMPSKILEKHYSFANDELTDRVANAKSHYNYDHIYNIVSKKINITQQKIQELETAYRADKGIEISIQLPEYDSLSPFFKQDGAEYDIDSEKSVLSDLLQLSNYSSELRVELKNKAIVYFKSTYMNYYTHLQTITFKLPANTIIAIDGEEDTVAHFAAKELVVKCHELIATENGEESMISLNLSSNEKLMNVAIRNGNIHINLS